MNTLDSLIAGIRADMEREQLGIDCHLALANVLREFQEKKVTIRIVEPFVNELRAIRPDAQDINAYIVNSYGMTNMRVFVNGIGDNNRVEMFIGYDTEPTEPRFAGSCVKKYFGPSFEHTDACHGEAAIIRNKKRKNLLDLENGILQYLAFHIDEIKKLSNSIKEITEYGRDAYEARSHVEKLLKD